MITRHTVISLDVDERRAVYLAQAYVYDGDTQVTYDQRYFDINSKTEAQDWVDITSLKLKEDYEMSLAADAEGGFDEDEA